MSSTIPPEHIPPGMKAVHVGVPFLPATMEALSDLGCKRAFVLTNKSSLRFIVGGDDDCVIGDDDDVGGSYPSSTSSSFVDALRDAGLLAAPVCYSVGMGGNESGLLEACDDASRARADVVITIGGGAIQDAGKLVRLWLSRKKGGGEEGGEENEEDDDDDDDDEEGASVRAILALSNREPMPTLVPQIALPNSFAMAEATSVAGLTTSSNVKSGASHPSLLPTIVIYDHALSVGLPDWVRYGTALRGVEHAVGAITHPNANEEIRSRAGLGLSIIRDNLRGLVTQPECPVAQCNIYVGGFIAVRALMTGCYPALGHLIENQYSARFGIHQGSCSGILCARIMDYHRGGSKEHQMRISAALGGEVVLDDDGGVVTASTPAPRLVRDLVSTLPGVFNEHDQANVTDDMLMEFAQSLFDNHIQRLNVLSPRSFHSVEDIYGMLTKPLADL
ncbi:hypothetical protein ACHAXA_000390 [Cyclostephanos tholiformis]|uniref:Alcohol dehydrogenase iron-type/glycerol dehydrogenase GldA domain-containing protein n=1 Tax=Cyclostephanos tholiformis TaxID=382380 RepID=A0ABD3R2P7_9STRA